MTFGVCFPRKKSYWSSQLHNLRVLLEMKKTNTQSKKRERKIQVSPKNPNDFSPVLEQTPQRCSPLEKEICLPEMVAAPCKMRSRPVSDGDEAMTYRRQEALTFPRGKGRALKSHSVSASNCPLFGLADTSY